MVPAQWRARTTLPSGWVGASLAAVVAQGCAIAQRWRTAGSARARHPCGQTIPVTIAYQRMTSPPTAKANTWSSYESGAFPSSECGKPTTDIDHNHHAARRLHPRRLDHPPQLDAGLSGWMTVSVRSMGAQKLCLWPTEYSLHESAPWRSSLRAQSRCSATVAPEWGSA